MSLTVSKVFVALADLQGGLVEFYRQLFQLEPVVWLLHYAEFELSGLRLGIFQPKADHRDEFSGRAGSMSLCLEVRQLEAAIERLTELGYPPPSAITMAAHGREIYAYDPAGNRLILHEAPVS
jgi:predicted enzyme related to lactoylglutathione lyase